MKNIISRKRFDRSAGGKLGFDSDAVPEARRGVVHGWVVGIIGAVVANA